MFCTSQPAGSAWTRTPTPSAEAPRPHDVEHLHRKPDRSFAPPAVLAVSPEEPDSPVPSLSPALRPCRKQWSSSLPLDGAAEPRTHPLLSQGGSAGSLLDDRGQHQHVCVCVCAACTGGTADLRHLSLCLQASPSCGALCL